MPLTDQPQLNLTAIPVADAAHLLSAVFGQHVTVEMIESDVAAGAPTDGDGTPSTVRYAAQLVGRRRIEND